MNKNTNDELLRVMIEGIEEVKGENVTLFSIGTFRPKNGRVYFRKSSKFVVETE